MADVVRVGVIGTGFGASSVAPAFEATDDCAVVEVVTPRDDAAVAALCARADVDLISVHSPPFLHLEHVRLGDRRWSRGAVRQAVRSRMPTSRRR